MFVDLVPVESAKEMFEAVTARSAGQDAIIKAGSGGRLPAEIRQYGKDEEKDGDMAIQLERTDDILKWLGEHKEKGQFLCGFSMETEHMLENSRAKLEKKNLDMIVANNPEGGWGRLRYRYQRGDADHQGKGDGASQDVQGGRGRKDPGRCFWGG